MAGADGCIYCPPSGASKVLRIDPATQTVTEIGEALQGGSKYFCAVAGADGASRPTPLTSHRTTKRVAERARREIRENYTRKAVSHC